ncbi:MAG: hypothetical protein LDLANPLL_02353 [Turneriella sp.]|nr:hypothetical protein [Turneriella sp.]
MQILYATTLFFLFLALLPLWAQELDIEEKKEVQPASVLTGRIAGGYAYSQFDSVSLLRQDNTVVWKKGANSIRAADSIAGGLGAMEGKFNASFSGSIDHYVSDWFEIFLFSTYYANIVSNMQGKYLVGAGGKIILKKTDAFLFDFSLAPTYSQTKYTDMPSDKAASISLRTRVRVKLSDSIAFSLPYFIVFSTENFTNQWHSLDPSFSYKVSDNTDMSAGYWYRYDSFSNAFSGRVYVTCGIKFENS